MWYAGGRGHSDVQYQETEEAIPSARDQGQLISRILLRGLKPVGV